MSVEQAEVEDDIDDDDQLEEPDFDAPLQLLNSVSARLLRGEIPTNPNRLQALFQHLQSVVGDVVDASFAKITAAFDQIEDANQALREDGEDSPASQAFFAEFETGREHIEEGLAIMQESFFSAQNIEDLEDFEEELREAEVQLAEGLGRLETAMIAAEDPDAFGLHPEVRSEYIEDATDAFASSLDALSLHLEDGKKEHLEFVLEKLDLAREFIEAALTDAVAAEEETDGEVSDADDESEDDAEVAE